MQNANLTRNSEMQSETACLSLQQSGFIFFDLVLVNAIMQNLEQRIEEMAVVQPELVFKRRCILVRNNH